MNQWYKFILNALFSRKKEERELDMADKEDDMLSDYMELDSLMQVIYHTPKETESGS